MGKEHYKFKNQISKPKKRKLLIKLIKYIDSFNMKDCI